MSKDPDRQSLVLPFLFGICLGIAAKLVDVPEMTSRFPVFDDVMGRFGIWCWAAALTAVFSKSPLFAAMRSFAFFAGMLSAYYGYTIFVLKFFPESQIILWSGIALVTPFCGFFLWQIHKNKWFTDGIASLPFILFVTEWYLTAAGDWLLFAVYLCMTVSWFAVIPENRTRLSGLLSGLLVSVTGIRLIQMGIIVDIYDLLLNI